MKFKTRKLVTPADLNPRGTLHGGQLLKWIEIGTEIGANQS